MSFAQNDSLVPKVFYYGDGTISSEGFFYNNQPVGYWKTYYPDGSIKSEGNRKSNALDGKWIFYNSSKDTSEIINYRNSLKNGWNIKYDSNKVQSKVLFLDGNIIGLSYQYLENSYLEIPHKNHIKHGLAFEYQDGKIISIIEYKNGFKLSSKKINRTKDSLKQGPWITFYENRRIHIDCFYKNDSLSGYYREYDRQGNLIKNNYLEAGKLVEKQSNIQASQFNTQYYDNGNIKSEGYYTFGIPVGLHTEYANDGSVSQGVLYSDDGKIIGKGGIDSKGRKNGKWTFYDVDNKVKAEGYYKKNRRVKNWVFYFKNGKIEQKGAYKSGRLSGEWIQYYSNNQIFKIENYRKSKLEGAFKQYSPKGEIFVEGTYQENLLDGEWIYYYKQETIHKFYDKGIKVNQWFTKYDNGKYAFKGAYEDGVPNGKHIYYYSNGTIKEFRYYIFGSKEKIWSTYDAFFDIETTYLYKNDKLVKINGKKYKFTD